MFWDLHSSSISPATVLCGWALGHEGWELHLTILYSNKNLKRRAHQFPGQSPVSTTLCTGLGNKIFATTCISKRARLQGHKHPTC